MATTFEEEFDKLYHLLFGFNPEEEDWFFPALKQLIDSYSNEDIWLYIINDKTPIYTAELLTKAGFRQIDASYFIHAYQNERDEDNQYSAALILAICGYKAGFEYLKQIIQNSGSLDIKADILPDLFYVKNPKINELYKLIESMNL